MTTFRKLLALVLLTASLSLAALAQRETLLIAASPNEGAVNIYQPDDAKLQLKKSISVSKAPGQLCINAAGTNVYVTDAPGKVITAVDLNQLAVIGTFTDPEMKGPDSCATSSD